MLWHALLRVRRQRPRRRAAEQRDQLAPSIKKTRSHGTIAKRAGLAKRPRSAKGLPFSSSRVGRKGRCVTHSITSSPAREQERWHIETIALAGFELVHALLAIDHAHTLLGTACVSSASAALKLRSPGAAPL